MGTGVWGASHRELSTFCPNFYKLKTALRNSPLNYEREKDREREREREREKEGEATIPTVLPGLHSHGAGSLHCNWRLALTLDLPSPCLS